MMSYVRSISRDENNSHTSIQKGSKLQKPLNEIFKFTFLHWQQRRQHSQFTAELNNKKSFLAKYVFNLLNA
jgi:hypothetical protein